MADRSTQKMLVQLDYERRWLSAKLSRGHRNLSEGQSQEILHRIDTLDFEIAASPAESFDDLLVKVNRLRELMFPVENDDIEKTIEGIFFHSVLKDTRVLADREINPREP